MDKNYTICLLDKKKHDVDDFACGTDALDVYLKEKASQEVKKKVAAVYIITEKAVKRSIGYYTLSSCSIALTNLPETVTRKLPKYNALPAVLIGRLAVDKKFQGKRIGEYLLLDALSRSYLLSRQIGSFAVIVDAKNEKSKSFYERYGFLQSVKHPLKLYLPMGTIKNLINNK